MTGWEAGHQTVICLPSNNVKMSTSIIVDTLSIPTGKAFYAILRAYVPSPNAVMKLNIEKK